MTANELHEWCKRNSSPTLRFYWTWDMGSDEVACEDQLAGREVKAGITKYDLGSDGKYRYQCWEHYAATPELAISELIERYENSGELIGYKGAHGWDEVDS